LAARIPPEPEAKVKQERRLLRSGAVLCPRMRLNHLTGASKR
jgi:hypothetical protein